MQYQQQNPFQYFDTSWRRGKTKKSHFNKDEMDRLMNEKERCQIAFEKNTFKNGKEPKLWECNCHDEFAEWFFLGTKVCACEKCREHTSFLFKKYKFKERV